MPLPTGEDVSKYQEVLKSLAGRQLSEISLPILSRAASPMNRLHKRGRFIPLGVVVNTKRTGMAYLVNRLLYVFSSKHFLADLVHFIPPKMIGIVKSFHDFPPEGL